MEELAQNYVQEEEFAILIVGWYDECSLIAAVARLKSLMNGLKSRAAKLIALSVHCCTSIAFLLHLIMIATALD